MKVLVGVSQRHAHLTKDDVRVLFGDNYELSKRNDLYQPGQYACEETVTIKGPKSEMANVRVLGPARDKTQVEVSKGDTIKLGINAPIRDSGDLDDAAEITIIGPNGSLTKKAAIIATRHIHLSTEEANKLTLTSHDTVTIIVGGEKPGILNNVHVRIDDNFKMQVHLDIDDANAFLINNDDEVDVITQ